MASVCGPMASDKADAAISFALRRLGVNFQSSDLKTGQRKAIDAVIDKRDAMVILPTGHGKSIIYWTAPFLSDFNDHAKLCGCDTENHIEQKNIAIVISPLIALMKDQVAALKRDGVRAIYMGEMSGTEDQKQLRDGTFSLVFCSPEGIFSAKGAAIMSSAVYRNHVCGIFVDEGHCIAKWGYKSGKVVAFRSQYSRLAELRSFVKSSTPMVVLTATASSSVQKTMSTSLGLVNATVVEESPDRNNIRYAVISSSLKEDSKAEHFSWLSKDLKDSKGDTEKVLIFCKTHRNSRTLHAVLTEDLSEEESGHVALFSSITEDSRKKYILNDFTKKDSRIRVLLATSAFGMGINVKGLHHVIGYGASRDIDDYFQESGRVGRDGLQSHALLLNYRGNFGKGKTNEDMRSYVNSSEDKCRRELLLAHYQQNVTTQLPPHNCCDICSKTCKCDGERCIAEDNGMSELERKMRAADKGCDDNKKRLCREVNEEVRDIIKDQLLIFRDSLLTVEEDKLYTGKDIASGFPMSLIVQIVKNYEYISSEEHLGSFPFFNLKHVSKVWNILEVLGGEAEDEREVTTSQNIDSQEDESDSEEENIESSTLSDYDEDDFEGQNNYISSQCSRIYLSDDSD